MLATIIFLDVMIGYLTAQVDGKGVACQCVPDL